MFDVAAALALMQLGDSAYPAGGFAFSWGVEGLAADGVRMQDGSVLPADVVVFATGYANQQEGVRQLLGDDVAERVGPIWGFDDNGTMRNMWQRTPQPGFWVMGGALMEARFHSRFLAVQIKAELEGLAPAHPAASA